MSVNVLISLSLLNRAQTNYSLNLQHFYPHRESLFAPVFKNKITQAPNNQPPGTIRFSTFGYDTPPGEKTLHRQSIHKDKCRMQPNTIEMEDFGHLTDIPPPPPKVCQKHDPKKSIKMEESRIYVDIRNSAPDVIIMTSHWQLRIFYVLMFSLG